MKVLVTGGAGQVGSRVADELVARGDEVLCIDNFRTGRPEHLQEHARLKLHVFSVAEKNRLRTAFEDFGPDVVVHAAASYKDPDDWAEDSLTNCVGGANVVHLAREFAVDRFIYLQTSLCYGLRPPSFPIPIDYPRNPEGSSYAITKTTNERFVELSGLDYVTFRLANVIGPRNLAGPLPIFFDRLMAGKRCFVSESRRDFVFVGDLARLIIMAVDGIGSGPYHFSSGSDVSIKELYDEVVANLGLDNIEEPETVPLGEDDTKTILLDPSKTWQDFGQFSLVPLPEIVARAGEYYRQFGARGGVSHLKRSVQDG